MTPPGNVRVFRVDSAWHPYPWRFEVTFGGRTWQFAGVPNMCETRRQAAARAGWRLRWLALGVMDRHYY